MTNTLRRHALAIGAVVMMPTLAMSQSRADFARADSAVVRLAPAAFPALPVEVRRDLDRRGCRVPQSYLDSLPHNVVHGAITATGRADWAVLCSIAGRSRILVYQHVVGRVADTTHVDSLEVARDANYLQSGVKPGAPAGIGFSRHIDLVPIARIRRGLRQLGERNPTVDHAGIEDAFLEKASEVLYLVNGSWRKLPGAD